MNVWDVRKHVPPGEDNAILMDTIGPIVQQ